MANPLFNENVKEQARILDGEPMTINGAINKTLILLACLFVAACYTWYLAFSGFADKAQLLTVGGAVAGFVLAMVIIFTRKAMHILAPLYTVCEGFFLGGISAVYAAQYAGIVMQAILATFAALFSMLILYRTGAIRCTERFRSVIFTATLSVAIVYFIQIVASFFGRGIPQIFTASPIGIGFSIIVVAIAALNLIIDFDFIERGSQELFEKKYEWYGAFGLMVSLIWLYLEILRLLAKLSDRN